MKYHSNVHMYTSCSNLGHIVYMSDRIYVHIYVHVLVRDERRKEERSKQGQTNKQGKVTQHTHFPKKNELPRVGLEPMTLYTLDRVPLPLSYRGSSCYSMCCSIAIHHSTAIYHSNARTHMYKSCTCIYNFPLMSSLSNALSQMREILKFNYIGYICTRQPHMYKSCIYIYIYIIYTICLQ